jgi:hypothetical protein
MVTVVSAPANRTPRGGTLRVAAICLAALLAAFGVDALLFRTGIYASILEPDSTTGIFELTFRDERQRQAENGDNMVVTVGDSRFAYLPRQANLLTPKSGYVFRNAGAAGTDARAWYYMLRDLDPTARRYRAVVVGVDDYDDEDNYEDHDDDIRVLHYAIMRLRLTDVIPLAGSFTTWAHRWEVFRGGVFKGFVLQRDVRAFVSHPRKRLKAVAQYNEGWENWTYNYVEDPRSLAGLQVDWKAWKATFPPGADDVQRSTVANVLMREVAPQTGRFASFRRRWLGRILDRYKGSRTKIIFLRLARGPVVRPPNLVRKLSSSIREFGARPNVYLVDEHALDSLERPELFKDALHLNRDGAALFAPKLVEEVAKILKQ